MTNEKVLVFSERLLEGESWEKYGVLKDASEVSRLLQNILYPANLFYLERDVAETDERFKQLIPYIIIKAGDNVFRYRRSKKGGEGRLHGLYSIGVGGHINPVDEQAIIQDTYETALRRELSEEIELQGNGTYSIKTLGCIYDSSTPVGRVHFGIVHLLKLDHYDFDVKTKDPALTDGGFMPVAYLKNHLDEFESWSAIALEHLL